MAREIRREERRAVKKNRQETWFEFVRLEGESDTVKVLILEARMGFVRYR